MRGNDFVEPVAADVLHDHPVVAVVVAADVEDRQEVGVLEVQALAHAAEFDVEVAADQLQRHLFARIADGVVHLAEAAVTDAALDRVPRQRLRPAGIHKLRHRGAFSCRARRVGSEIDEVGVVRFHGNHRWFHG